MSNELSAYLKQIPNFKFTDTNDNEYHIHDLLKDRVVILNLFYATCHKKCIPIGKNLVKVYKIIGDEKFKEYKITMISITFDPKNDTNGKINNYRKLIGATNFPNWYFLKGGISETEVFRRKIGMYEDDDLLDNFRQSHSGNILILNEQINRNKMAGGFENCLNIVRKSLGLVLPYAYSNTGNELLTKIDFTKFSEDEKISFLDNIITMSPSFTTPFLPGDMLEIFKSYIKSEYKNGFQSKINYEDLEGNKTEPKTDKEIKEITQSLQANQCCCSRK